MAGVTTASAPSHRLSFIRLYVLLVVLPLACVVVFLALGSRLDPALPAAVSTTQGAAGPSFDLALLLAQIVVIVATTRAVGWGLGRFGQTRVIGEMLAGILLGPSFLGTFFPGATAAIFPAASLAYLNALSQVGLVLFMFLVGLELDLGHLRRHGHIALVTSHASIITPLSLGCVLALPLYERLAGIGVGFPAFALFMGGAMSVTAFPVLARILIERRLLGTRLGALAISCAAIGDVSAWCLLAAVAALVRGRGAGLPLWVTVGGTAVYALVMLTVGRRLLSRLELAFERSSGLEADVVAVLLLLVLTSAWMTQRLGIHALFGAFLVGVAVPRHAALVRSLEHRLGDLLHLLFLPLFFALTGLRTHLGLISSGALWLMTLAIVAVAIVGKLGGSAVAARLAGLPWREAAAIGVLMNTRGLVEIVFLNVGLDLGVISPTLFTMMVLMALVTTFMTSPLLALVWSPAQQEAEERSLASSLRAH